MRHDAQAFTGHLVLMAVHPRLQAAVAQTDPFVFTTLLIAESMDDFLQITRGMSYQEWYIGVYLIDQSHDGNSGRLLRILCKVAAQAVDITLGMRLNI